MREQIKLARRKNNNHDEKLITAVVARPNGQIFELEGYAAVGMANISFLPLTTKDTVNMPFGGELMMLPDRLPVLYNIIEKRYEILKENPYKQGEKLFAVAAFNSPGYFNAYLCAYKENENKGYLPLFSYGAVGWHKGKFRTTSILVDSEKRQDLRLMKSEDVIAGIDKTISIMPDNRLCKHLEKCALEYGCPAAKNFFLGRYEAPLPTSKTCNARCRGCISFQESNDIKCSQERIGFTPTPEEIAEVALFHIQRVEKAVVSLGQGCEGDPLLSAQVIEPAIRLIRLKTESGTINMNTNGSKPDIISDLFKAGLDSIRISLNSVREKYYRAYFRPVGYKFSDVKKSIETAIRNKKLISINYLNCPGFTDTPNEFDALTAFLEKYPVNMIQWRNLNFDPIKYYEIMESIDSNEMPLGMKNILKLIKKKFPKIRHGYFNPPKEDFLRIYKNFHKKKT